MNTATDCHAEGRHVWTPTRACHQTCTRCGAEADRDTVDGPIVHYSSAVGTSPTAKRTSPARATDEAA
jgi:hypothetical protein